MGYGDEIMAGGHALRVHRETGRRIRIVDKNREPRWHELWEGLPWILRPEESDPDAVDVQNGPDCRPYMIQPMIREGGYCVFSSWRARDHVGVINFTPAEIAFAEKATAKLGDFILIEPNIPINGVYTSNPNKFWGEHKWRQLAKLLSRCRLVQVGRPGTIVVDGAHFIETETFRLGAAVMQRARLSILPEGGFHHACAAMGTDAVVLFGGCIDVNTTGYPLHTNIVQGEACGMLFPCDHCREIWEQLDPRKIAEIALEKWNRLSPGPRKDRWRLFKFFWNR